MNIDLRRLGWALAMIGLALALIASVFGVKNDWLITTALLFFFGGFALLGVSAIIRLKRGQLRLRPWLALKQGFMFFLLFLGIRLAYMWWVPSFEQSLSEAIFVSAFTGICFGLWQSAYRKP
ncbi:hypothetical protein QWY75_02800 [Pontixanthobacter aestiaquae]|uniref:Uncharacterized protein n=1 Tax=Pontixanthobacter aestiaquae TaxID=1509367 RepID=A0A844ZA08_9SPHN|nr:hypothetical protein [Pontixanthobacter aestiaquae]MDN3645133.1 hypothetical protein [Pontixanthobacter aestiaquae]MXO83867.1 hypothetical protein [Pontixanthobacter aestiaquae]